MLKMGRLFILVFVTFALFGCGPNAVSQNQEREPQRVVTRKDSAQTAISLSRRTAITEAVEAVAPAVVSINVTEVERYVSRDPLAEWIFGLRPRVYEKEVKQLGSGFVISPDGYIVTNEHVAGNAVEIWVAFPNGDLLEAELVGSDELSDLALIKVEPEEPLPYLAFATENRVLVGEWVIALGNPYGLFEAREPSVTVGVVSGLGRDYRTNGRRSFRDMIQTDAAINPGNSGGPLVNALGEVIGVNTFIYTQSGGNVGIGFAVPAERAGRVVNELRETGEVDRQIYTGLSVSSIARQPRIARALNLEKAEGILVESVDRGSPAADAGIEAYDVILAIEGDPVQDLNDARSALAVFRPGDEVTFTILRKGREREVTILLDRRS